MREASENRFIIRIAVCQRRQDACIFLSCSQTPDVNRKQTRER